MGEEDRLNEVYFCTDIQTISKAFEKCGIKDFYEKEVLVKLHMGEIRNRYYPRPGFIRDVLDELYKVKAMPFLYDTTVCYRSPRNTIKGYLSVARLHGFSERKIGCKIVIDDHGVPIDVEDMSFNVGTHLCDIQHVVAISHVKGHNGTGMGGAIKNFGMGGVTKETKRWMHTQAKPRYISMNCTFCGQCEHACPFHAITVKEQKWIYSSNKCFGCDACVQNCTTNALTHQSGYSLQYLLACAAKASVQEKNVIYLNELKRISKNCDCDPFAGPIICPDIGYLVSTDPVAIDTASIDLIYSKRPDIFRKKSHIDPYDQIRSAEKIGLGTSQYTLITL